MWYDAYIMMSRTQISMDAELLAQARRRAADLGISLAGYVRRLVESDLGAERPAADPAGVFDLGDSGGSDVARHEDAMLGEALDARRRS